MKRFALATLVLGLLAVLYLCFNRTETLTSAPKMTTRMAAMKKDLVVADMQPLAGLMKLPEKLAKEFKQLQPKVLLSKEDKEHLSEFYSDKARIDAAKTALLVDEKALNRESEKIRMKAIDYLTHAIGWDKNPQHDYVVSAVSSVLNADNIVGQSDMDYKKSLAGDKVELYEVMLKSDPAAAADLLEKSRGTVNYNIMTYAKGMLSNLSRPIKAS